MEKITMFLVISCVCGVFSLPLDSLDLNKEAAPVLRDEDLLPGARPHSVQRRFVDPLFSLGETDAAGLTKIRAKRSAEECEKLQLCKLHARSRQSFFAAYELYFVNKENARLWDHRARSVQECEQRFGGCYYR